MRTGRIFASKNSNSSGSAATAAPPKRENASRNNNQRTGAASNESTFPHIVTRRTSEFSPAIIDLKTRMHFRHALPCILRSRTTPAPRAGGGNRRTTEASLADASGDRKRNQEPAPKRGDFHD